LLWKPAGFALQNTDQPAECILAGLFLAALDIADSPLTQPSALGEQSLSQPYPLA
jgi:hypothetical protein